MFRRFYSLAVTIGLTTIALAPCAVSAQDYPTRPVTVIVAQPPGGGTDIIARIISAQLSAQTGQPFVVENRAGAGTVVGTATAANSTPDG